MKEDDQAKSLRERLLGTERTLTRSGAERLWKTGRGAAGLAFSALGGRLRGKGEGLGAADARAVAQLVSRLGELKGLAMKAGQILGYIDPTLPEELRGLLSVLQTASPASPFPQVEAELRTALGARADLLLAGLERQPISVASIGQVHRARLPEGTEVAVKVRHPGIDEAFRSDFRTAGAGSTFAALLVPGAASSVRGFIEEARTVMLEECDFALERERQATFARLLADDETLLIPAVEPDWCARTVLTTRWTPGRSLDAFLEANPSQEVRDRMGIALFSFYVGMLYRHGLFHGDPHPGNYAFREDGRAVVYDFGCVRHFEPATVLAFSTLLEAVRADETPRMSEALEALGARPPTDAEGRAMLRTLLRGFFAPLLEHGAHPMHPGPGLEAQQLLRDKRFLAKLSLPGRFLFLFRLRFGLYAVLARLGSVVDWGTLESRWAEEAQQRGGTSA
ncbi:ABC1 kinase family protein [Cystobacter ferrugineus]|uniref:ABC1 kinase family protein n=1 Tax=Cystobacter ferrugineus TaxID=83449 RepID=UPI000A4428A6|nr:AarF/ABC1/UbiB kinase family protein [Cystobacter ferrugineus]